MDLRNGKLHFPSKVMELYEREFFLSQLLLDKKIVEIGDLVLYIYPLTIDQNYIAQKVFRDTYEEALFSGVFARKEMRALMVREGIWSKEKDLQLTRNTKAIEDSKLAIYNNFLVPSRREQSRLELRGLEKEQASLFQIKHTNDHLDCEGLATYARWNWIIENTTKHTDNSPYLFNEVDITTMLRLNNDWDLETEQLREMSRTEPWASIWLNSGKNPERIFRRHAFELTKNQDEIVSWSGLYENVAGAGESPKKEIIEDNDALDGWLIAQSREAEKEKGKKQVEGFEQAHQNADEVFIMTRSREETDAVYNLNEGEAKMRVKSRNIELKKAGKEGIKYEKFNDVKLRVINEASEKFGNR